MFKRSFNVNILVNIETATAHQDILRAIHPWLVEPQPLPSLPDLPAVTAEPLPQSSQRTTKETYWSDTACRHGHTNEHGKTERFRGSNSCVTCLRLNPPRRKPRVLPAPEVVSSNGHQTPLHSGHDDKRPELPAHLALTAFLSPITCQDATHRYRDLDRWTLRYIDSEECVMCTTQQSAPALAGD